MRLETGSGSTHSSEFISKYMTSCVSAACQQHFEGLVMTPRAPRLLTFNSFILQDPCKIKRNAVSQITACRLSTSRASKPVLLTVIHRLPPTCRHMRSLTLEQSLAPTRLVHTFHATLSLLPWTEWTRMGPRDVYTHTHRLTQTASDCNLGDLLTLRLTLSSV